VTLIAGFNNFGEKSTIDILDSVLPNQELKKIYLENTVSGKTISWGSAHDT
jgi:hypothetical protein